MIIKVSVAIYCPTVVPLPAHKACLPLLSACLPPRSQSLLPLLSPSPLTRSALTAALTAVPLPAHTVNPHCCPTAAPLPAHKVCLHSCLHCCSPLHLHELPTQQLLFVNALDGSDDTMGRCDHVLAGDEASSTTEGHPLPVSNIWQQHGNIITH